MCKYLLRSMYIYTSFGFFLLKMPYTGKFLFILNFLLFKFIIFMCKYAFSMVISFYILFFYFLFIFINFYV